MKILHVIGGDLRYGASKGAFILHNALLKLGQSSVILNDTPGILKNGDEKIKYINDDLYNKFLSNFYVLTEKILKTFFLPSPRETFTLGLLGHDITRSREYKNADIVHFHWLNQGFVKISCLSKIDKPVVWTLRDMWAFTGGSHYDMDFEKYETTRISKFMQNYKKKHYGRDFNFITISDWLKIKAKDSFVLKKSRVERIYNNIDLENFNPLSKDQGKKDLGINTQKQIILYGANNPQSKRKGWDIFVETLKRLDKSKYYILIFGSFWSHKILNKTGMEYKSLGFIHDKKVLNSAYSCADLFVASSIQDGWPKTFAEALYCKTPVVCFANTSISEIIEHKVNGYIVKELNSNQLKIGIEWLSNALKKNSLSFQKTKIKITDFGSLNIAKKYIELYKNVLYKKK